MLNGDGLRVVLWLSGCSHNCYKCQNPQTHNPNSGILFDEMAEEELFRELSKDYISGLTLTGGDPLHENNLDEVLKFVNRIRLLLPNKTIWLYTGYEIDVLYGNTILFKPSKLDLCLPDNEFKEQFDIELKRSNIVKQCSVVVDGRYIDSQKDVSLRWRGSSNQRVIDIQKSLQQGEVVLYCE